MQGFHKKTLSGFAKKCLTIPISHSQISSFTAISIWSIVLNLKKKFLWVKMQAEIGLHC